jgi:hypothetical protein
LETEFSENELSFGEEFAGKRGEEGLLDVLASAAKIAILGSGTGKSES